MKYTTNDIAQLFPDIVRITDTDLRERVGRFVENRFALQQMGRGRTTGHD